MSQTQRKEDGNGAPKVALEHYEGTSHTTEKYVNNFMAVAKGEGGVMKHVGKDAKVTERRADCVNMMMVGYGGDDAKKAADVFKEITDHNIHIVVRRVGEPEQFDRKLPATKTVGHVILLMGKKYHKFYKITRNGTELNDDLTLAQAAQTGSTINWIAKE